MSDKPAPATDESFVAIWQKAATLAEAADLANMTPRDASVRAFRMRKAGVPLKTFQTPRGKIDVVGLTRIARQTTPTKKGRP